MWRGAAPPPAPPLFFAPRPPNSTPPTYGSPLFADHVPARSHPLVEHIERKGGIVMGKSNTPEFGAGGSTFNEVFGRTRNPWNTALTSGGSTGGGAGSVASGDRCLAQGTSHGGSLPGPGSHC